uniref:Uncharacterized protein n=1 Tax=Denticeps clupeoides TaxID=299321 RepID=A0AAY4E8I3_9TELE
MPHYLKTSKGRGKKKKKKKKKDAPAMLGNASLSKSSSGKACLPLLFPLSSAGTSLRETVAGRWLMSSVLNHRTAEWFYAYFICISLNRGGRFQCFKLGLIPICGGRMYIK